MALSDSTIDRLNMKVRSFMRVGEETSRDTTKELVAEAIEQLQQFKDKTIVETVADSATETTLSKIDERFICLYAAMHFDGRHDLQEAIDLILSRVRTK